MGANKCQSMHSTTTPATTPEGPCLPGTMTDGCFSTGQYAADQQQCLALGPIGCDGQYCSWITNNSHTQCQSQHATTTYAPCVPKTNTDPCWTRCEWGCH